MSKTVNHLLSIVGGLALFFFSLSGCTSDGPSEAEEHTAAIAALPRAQVNISTQYGDMLIELFNETPQHRDNFLKLAKEGFYDSLLLHRVQPNFMAQGGDPESRDEVAPETRLGNHQMDYRIPSEVNSKFLMRYGALCGYHTGLGANPDTSSNGSQFMLIHGHPVRDHQLKAISLELKKEYTPEQAEIYNQYGGLPKYDGKYTVFGQITEGLKILDKIVGARTHRSINSGLPDRPVEDIRMIITVVRDAPDETL